MDNSPGVLFTVLAYPKNASPAPLILGSSGTDLSNTSESRSSRRAGVERWMRLQRCCSPNRVAGAPSLWEFRVRPVAALGKLQHQGCHPFAPRSVLVPPLLLICSPWIEEHRCTSACALLCLQLCPSPFWALHLTPPRTLHLTAPRTMHLSPHTALHLGHCTAPTAPTPHCTALHRTAPHLAPRAAPCTTSLAPRATPRTLHLHPAPHLVPCTSPCATTQGAPCAAPRIAPAPRAPRLAPHQAPRAPRPAPLAPCTCTCTYHFDWHPHWPLHLCAPAACSSTSKCSTLLRCISLNLSLT